MPGTEGGESRPAPAPPHGEPPPSPADAGNIDGEDEQADGNHPEAQNGQEADEPACDEQSPEPDAHPARTREMKMASGKFGPRTADVALWRQNPLLSGKNRGLHQPRDPYSGY